MPRELDFMSHTAPPEAPTTPENEGDDTDRRSALSGVSRALMAGGLLAGYGAFASIAVRFLYPSRPAPTAWAFVAEVSRLEPGRSLVYRTPAGARAAITRLGSTGTVDDFVALSSTCPHLGCQVHWEAVDNRFFCPCHNGAFDPSGKAIAGPPAEAGQSLLRFPVKIERGLLFIEVPVESLAQGEGWTEEPEPPTGPGHDPCLAKPCRKRGLV